MIKNILITIIFLLIAVISTLIVIGSNASILSKLATHYLHVNTSVVVNKINLDDYEITATLNNQNTLYIHARYSSFNSADVVLNYRGDIEIFSKVATVKLPHIDVDIDTRIDNSLTAHIDADILDGTLKSDFNLNNFTYSAKLDNISLLSFEKQQNIEPYMDANATITSSGKLENMLDINLTLKSSKILLLPRTKELIKIDTGNTPTIISLDTQANLKDTKLNLKLDIDSNLADLHVNRLNYDLNRSNFDIALHVNNHLKQFSPLKSLLIDSKGSYVDGKLLADTSVNADDYILNLKRAVYENSLLHVRYDLNSNREEFVNISGNNKLFGELSYSPKLLKADISSKLLKDKILINFSDNILHINSKKLSLAGVLKHLKQENFAKADISINTEANLSKTLKWKTDIDTSNLKLSKKLRQIVKNNKNIALHVKAFNVDDDLIIIKPTIKSVMLNLEQGDIKLHTKSGTHQFVLKLRDINSSFYQTPFADINGSITQKNSIFGSVDIDSLYENIHLNFKKDTDKTDASFKYKFAHLERFAPLNPSYIVDGFGDLSLMDKSLHVNLNTKKLADTHIIKNGDDIDLKIDRLSLKELLFLSKQKRFADADISLKAHINPKLLHINIDTPQITPIELNSTIRPTPLHVSADLDTNMSFYSGDVRIKTAYENIVFNHIKFMADKKIYSSDFSIESDDLQKATPILPDILVGKTDFFGNIYFNNILRLHVNNNALYLSEDFHKKVDKNATGRIKIDMQSDIKFKDSILNIDFVSKSPYYNLHTFKTDIDLNSSTIKTTLKAKSNLLREKAEVNMKMNYINPYKIDASIKSDYEDIDFKNIRVDTDTLDLNGSYKILLRKTPKLALFHHGDAVFRGKLSNKGGAKVTLFSDSFDGNINITATQKNININANNLSLEKVMSFVETSSALKSGNFNLDANINSDDFTKLDIKTLKGDINLDADTLILEGVDADESINKLRNYEDISIFEGNFPGMGIISSIVKAPVNMLSEKVKIKSEIERIYAATYIENGKFYCYDCAVKTKQNRIAVKGAIDINSTEFHYFQVGLLQKNGCAFFTQDIKGSAKNPEIQLSKTSLSLLSGTVKSAGGVLKNGVNFGTSLISKTGGYIGNGIDKTVGTIPVVNRATGAVSGTITAITDAPDSANHKLTIQCEPFYRGVVSHPK